MEWVVKLVSGGRCWERQTRSMCDNAAGAWNNTNTLQIYSASDAAGCWSAVRAADGNAHQHGLGSLRLPHCPEAENHRRVQYDRPAFFQRRRTLHLYGGRFFQLLSAVAII